MSVRTSTSVAALNTPAAAGVIAVMKDVRSDKAAAEAKRKKEVEAALARMQAASDSGSVAAAKDRLAARYEETKQAQAEEKTAKEKRGKLPAGAYWVRGYYQDRNGKRVWVSGYWSDGVRKSDPVILVRKGDAGATEQRLALAAVYMPDVQDSQGDFMSAEEIRKTMWEYMARGDNFCVDLNHDGKVTSCQVVESFIVRKGDPDFPIPGTWVVGIHIPDDGLWAKVQKGELNGVSMEGMGRALARDAAPNSGVDIICKGATAAADDHVHDFELVLDKGGRIVGGQTSVHKDANGVEHSHKIVKGVVTEEAGGHRHRFNTLGTMKLKKFDATNGETLGFYDSKLALMDAAAKRGDARAYIAAYMEIHPNMRGEAHKRAIEAIISAGAFDKYLRTKGAMVTGKLRGQIEAAKRAGNYTALLNYYTQIEPTISQTAIADAANDALNSYRVTAPAKVRAERMATALKDLKAGMAGDKKALSRALNAMRAMDVPMLQKLSGVADLRTGATGKNQLVEALYGKFANGAKPPATLMQNVARAGVRVQTAIGGLLPKRARLPAKNPTGLKNLAGFKVWWDNDEHFDNALKSMNTWSDTQVRRAHNLLTGKFHGGSKREMISSLRAFRSNQMIASRVNAVEGKPPLPRHAMRPHAFTERYFVKPHKRYIDGKWVDVSGYWVDPTDRAQNVRVLEERIQVAAKQKLKPAVIAKKPPVSAANRMVKVRPAIRVPKPMARLPGALGWLTAGAQFFMKEGDTAAERVAAYMHYARGAHQDAA